MPSLGKGPSFLQAQTRPNSRGQQGRPWQTQPPCFTVWDKGRQCPQSPESKLRALCSHRTHIPGREQGDGEAEAPRGTSSCLSVTRCLERGLGTRPMLNGCQLRWLLLQSRAPLLHLESSQGVRSPHFPDPDPGPRSRGWTSRKTRQGTSQERWEDRWRAPAALSTACLWAAGDLKGDEALFCPGPKMHKTL